MLKLPRHVIPKRPASGKTAFYYNVPSKYRALNCPVRNEPLGTDYAEMVRRAETLNGIFDEWDQQRKGLPISAELMPKYGTVDWLFREYKISKAYLEKVAPRSRQNYEWAMREVCDTLTKKGDRVGGRLVKTISPRGADKLYDRFIARSKGGERLRTAVIYPYPDFAKLVELIPVTLVPNMKHTDMISNPEALQVVVRTISPQK